jgi:hypothetical protein
VRHRPRPVLSEKREASPFSGQRPALILSGQHPQDRPDRGSLRAEDPQRQSNQLVFSIWNSLQQKAFQDRDSESAESLVSLQIFTFRGIDRSAAGSYQAQPFPPQKFGGLNMKKGEGGGIRVRASDEEPFRPVLHRLFEIRSGQSSSGNGDDSGRSDETGKVQLFDGFAPILIMSRGINMGTGMKPHVQARHIRYGSGGHRTHLFQRKYRVTRPNGNSGMEQRRNIVDSVARAHTLNSNSESQREASI